MTVDVYLAATPVEALDVHTGHPADVPPARVPNIIRDVSLMLPRPSVLLR